MRRASHLAQIEAKMGRVRRGQEDVFLALDSLRQAIDHLYQLEPDPRERVCILEAGIQIAKGIEAAKQKRVTNGLSRPDDLAQAQYYRLNFELRLLREKKRAATDLSNK